LLAIAREPNLTIEEAFKRVRVAVNQATDGRQIPWESSSLTGDFKFFADDEGPAATAPKPPATTARTTSDWRRDLKGQEPKAALERVIADDGNRAFGAVAAITPAVVAPTKVALAPTCPCSAPTTPAPPPLKRKVEVTPEPTRHADKPPRKRRPPPDDDIVVERGPPGPPPVYVPPGAVMEGVGIGIGLGAFGGRGGGMGGGGGGFRR
jgi:hypothetical protein